MEGLEFKVLADRAIFIVYHIGLHLLIILKHKDIYKAMAGGNGIPQPNELIKLIAAYAFAIYCPEVIFNGLKFDVQFGLMLLGAVGVANLTDIRNYLKEFNNGKKEDTTKENHPS